MRELLEHAQTQTSLYKEQVPYTLSLLLLKGFVQALMHYFY